MKIYRSSVFERSLVCTGLELLDYRYRIVVNILVQKEFLVLLFSLDI